MNDVLQKIENSPAPGPDIMFHCPGCDMRHGVRVGDGGARWSWNGSMTKPTLSPSILVTMEYPQGVDRGPIRAMCHSFVTDGRIQFLHDCTHGLAGQTVDLKPIE